MASRQYSLLYTILTYYFCARVVSGRRRSDHISDVIQQLGWLRADELAEYHTICAVQRAITTGTPEHISQTIGPVARDIHDHDTRNAGLITQPRARTETGRRRLCIRGVAMLNGVELNPYVPAFPANVKRLDILMLDPRKQSQYLWVHLSWQADN